jgi:glycerophosphoryl diester phosphodiesterase
MFVDSFFFYVGHRGTRAIFDENTIEAFEKAIEFGANYIEFDVRKTKDGEIVVLHDSTLDRTTTGEGILQNFNFDELRKFRTKIHNHMIPKLSEVLKILKGKTQFIIEIKEDNIADEILNIIYKHKLSTNCVLSSRNLHELEKVKSSNPNIEICYNITKGSGFRIKEFLILGKIKKLKFKANLINLRSTLISKEFIKVCQINKIKSLAWDFLTFKNPIFQIKSCIKAGINGILFDDHRNIPLIKFWINST